MKTISTKDTAEAVLRELPSVLGACVREDINGHPREVHLLVGPGPNVRNLARDVRNLLEERLRVPVDQRVISIAQMSARPAALSAEPPALTAPTRTAALSVERAAANFRPSFAGLETSLQGARVLVRVKLQWGGREFSGESAEVDAGHGRLRAAASAALRAATSSCNACVRMDLDNASVVRALDRDYVIVTALAGSAMIGRKPLSLSGAQSLDEDPVTAAAFAALKAVNRVLELGLRACLEEPAGY